MGIWAISTKTIICRDLYKKWIFHLFLALSGTYTLCLSVFSVKLSIWQPVQCLPLCPNKWISRSFIWTDNSNQFAFLLYMCIFWSVFPSCDMILDDSLFSWRMKMPEAERGCRLPWNGHIVQIFCLLFSVFAMVLVVGVISPSGLLLWLHHPLMQC